MPTTPSPGSHKCDTLPPPRFPSSSSPIPVNRPSSPPIPPPVSVQLRSSVPLMQSSFQPTQRKLCVRHRRIADQGTNIGLQQALDALPEEERQVVNSIWSNFSSSAHPRRELILKGLLTMCCFSQLSLLTEQLGLLIRIDPFTALPREVSLKILAHLDATSLCRAAQVSKHWRSLADDDILWREICQQHIGQKCPKCGWGLPVLERRRQPSPGSVSPFLSPPSPPFSSKRSEFESADSCLGRPLKRHKSDDPAHSHIPPSPPSPTPSLPAWSTQPADLLILPSNIQSNAVTRPWKDVYSERLTIERNWRRGRCRVRTLRGHTDGVMCLQFSETLRHPSFPILITGSYDRTIRVWNLETGVEVRCLRGHTRAVRALQFDEAKLITGSMDHTIRVWNWRKGDCIRTLEGHTEGVVCLNFDAHILASGSADTTVKIWNFLTGEAFTLRGHRDWVNAVRLWDAHETARSPSDPCPSTLNIDTGKMLFSASDDGTIRLWDLAKRTCVRQFVGHVAQVQSLRILDVDDESDEHNGLRAPDTTHATENSSLDVVRLCGGPNAADVCTVITHDMWKSRESTEDKNRTASNQITSTISKPARKPVLISGSLDNTVKVWDVETAKASRTLFGHIEGVWAVACDKLRLVSGSHDRTIKVWSREEGRCTATLFGHRGAVTCVGLGEDKVVSGSDDGDVKVWSFSDHE